jgi:hypothetical protein
MAPDKPTLPAGLDWDLVGRAIKIVEEWEISGSESSFDLVVSLYCVLLPDSGSKVD